MYCIDWHDVTNAAVDACAPARKNPMLGLRRGQETLMKRVQWSVLITLIFAVAANWTGSVAPAFAQAKPDLVVLIAIDQFSELLFDQWRGRFKSGLKRLSEEGIVYSNAYQSHGLTETCVGHSTMLTGKHPRGTGIVANEWFDTAIGDRVYCVEAPAFTVASNPKRHVGPTNLLATTLGDWMKDREPNSRVVTVSGKDRSAITMAGHNGDGVFWYEDSFGFTTYLSPGEDASAKLAPLSGLNSKIRAETASPPPWVYSEDACRTLEADYQFGGRTWHSKLPPENPSGANVRPVHLIDPYTMEASRILIEHYQLGRRGVPDLLAVGLSATDFVGHGYGTQGPEMCDHLYRLDAQVGAFLAFLDQLGPRVLVVLTADHGGSDFVERLALRGYANAKRIDSKAFLGAVNDQLKTKFSLTADPLVTPDFIQFYAVDAEKHELSEPLRTNLIEAALAILRGRDEVEDAFALNDLLVHEVKHTAQSDYSLRDRYALNVMDHRSGDIIVAFKSGIATGPALPTGFLMGHSGPYRHDMAVPIVFWWRGTMGQTRVLPVDTTMIAPTLANIIQVQPPADIDGICFDLGFPGAQRCKR
jgi:predicted AlkP superfamily pyrophosphatase or phosphodiesterase